MATNTGRGTTSSDWSQFVSSGRLKSIVIIPADVRVEGRVGASARKTWLQTVRQKRLFPGDLKLWSIRFEVETHCK